MCLATSRFALPRLNRRLTTTSHIITRRRRVLFLPHCLRTNSLHCPLARIEVTTGPGRRVVPCRAFQQVIDRSSYVGERWASPIRVCVFACASKRARVPSSQTLSIHKFTPISSTTMITPLLLLAILVVIPFLPATTPIGTTTTMDPRTSSKYMQIPALVQDLQIYQGFTFITFGIQFWCVRACTKALEHK